MLAEKLLLHVLIILVPVLIYTVLVDRRIGKSPYLIGILQGFAAFLCMIFPYFSYGLYWDFRYVPLVMSILYGGPRAGLIVFAVIVATRTYIGGDALFFGYASAILAAIIPFLFQKKFWSFSAKIRIRIAVLIGFWPALVQLFILISFMLIHNSSSENSTEILFYVFVFGSLHVVGIGFAAMLHEAIIEKRLMKQEIQRAEKVNTLGELAASLAHEVRNPLTVVKGFLQLMQQQEKGKNVEYLTLVLSELGRAEHIISDYLNFAKPQFTKIEEFRLADALSDIILLLNPLALKQGVNLDTELENSMYLKTDKNQLKQALVNIIKNAIEATPSGGSVTVHSKFLENQAFIYITDTGKGMTTDQLSRIGTLFYSTKDKGTGIGTSVSLRIIETMNGKVLYKSKPGIGTEVRLSLPVFKVRKLG
ncbi:ATP-binding protein [Metabacillus herbersteinensis]|uniref:histidine kinase n=1 Tax=Metabacillus herbersteinensis TaxID=283816 RepID=A0ABV6GGV5_9BACI